MILCKKHAMNALSGVRCCLVGKSCLTLMWFHGLQPARLLCPWDFAAKKTGMGCHFLLQEIFLTQGSYPHLLHQQAELILCARYFMWIAFQFYWWPEMSVTLGTYVHNKPGSSSCLKCIPYLLPTTVCVSKRKRQGFENAAGAFSKSYTLAPGCFIV